MCSCLLSKKKNSYKVVQVFNDLEKTLGLEKFQEIISSILTDRNPSLADFLGIEFSAELGIQRTKLFFCDAFKSNQKASVENMNKQLRKYFPKGKSVDKFTNDDVKDIADRINNTPLYSLDGHTPKEAFVLIFGEETYLKLFSK